MASGQAETIVGIDLGTTNSLVAFADERGPRVIHAARGGGRDSGMVPSVVAIDPVTGAVDVGMSARVHAIERPEVTVYSIKRLMGRGFEDVQGEIGRLPYRVVRRPGSEGRDLAAVEIGPRVYSPPEISAFVLRDLKERAEAHFERAIHKAIITVPAYFDDAQRQATRDAGKIAGLEVVRIINEPTAAALAYGLDRNDESTIAVYDLGGGTFDISVLRLSGGTFEVLSTHGDTHLGGDDFDWEIIHLVQQEVRKRYGEHLQFPPSTLQGLRNLAEAVKIRLSSEERVAFEIDLDEGRSFQLQLSRAELEKMIEPYVQRTLDSCGQAMQDAKLEPAQIDQVVLVGGSTRIPYVRRRLQEHFGREPYSALNPDEVVALGAAVQASVISGAKREVLLLDVVPLSLGIETLGGAVAKLILRNTRVPCQATEMFTTFIDGQTSIQLTVLQGERELAKDCRKLGQFELRGIPPMPAGLPKVQVTFLIDQNGILHVSAREQRSGKEASIQVIPAHGLTRDEVRQMEKDAYAHAREDMLVHRLIDVRNQVTFDTAKTEQALAQAGPRLDAELRQKITDAMAELRQMAETTTDAEALNQALQDFDRLTIPLAEHAVAEALRESQAGGGGNDSTE
jgi:chaperone protein DnaK